MVASLNPVMGELLLTPMEPRIWIGGPSENCWRMYYNSSEAQWELEGGGGLVRYTQSSSFDCNGPNLFDVLLVDLTLQAPPTITVYPLSPLPCTCPGLLEPERGAFNLTPYEPTIRGHLAPAMGVLALTPFAPAIIGPLPSCDLSATPATLHVLFHAPSGGCTCKDAWTFDIVKVAGDTYQPTGVSIFVPDPCGGQMSFIFRCNAGLFTITMNRPFFFTCLNEWTALTYTSSPYHWTFAGTFVGGDCGCFGPVTVEIFE